jgi:ABC-type phosphate transport system auxiliary subunit
MNEQQRATINQKLDRLRLKQRRKTNWGKGFVIPKKKTDIEFVEAARFKRIAVAKSKVKTSYRMETTEL